MIRYFQYQKPINSPVKKYLGKINAADVRVMELDPCLHDCTLVGSCPQCNPETYKAKQLLKEVEKNLLHSLVKDGRRL